LNDASEIHGNKKEINFDLLKVIDCSYVLRTVNESALNG